MHIPSNRELSQAFAQLSPAHQAEVFALIDKLNGAKRRAIESGMSPELVDAIPSVDLLRQQALIDSGQKRPIGLAKGEFEVPDDFDDPLPEDILRAFEGED